MSALNAQGGPDKTHTHSSLTGGKKQWNDRVKLRVSVGRHHMHIKPHLDKHLQVWATDFTIDFLKWHLIVFVFSSSNCLPLWNVNAVASIFSRLRHRMTFDMWTLMNTHENTPFSTTMEFLRFCIVVFFFFLIWCGRLQIESRQQDQAFWIHYSHSSSPVSAAVRSVRHQGGWGGPHHLPRYGLPKDWSANRPRGMPWLKQCYVGHEWN